MIRVDKEQQLLFWKKNQAKRKRPEHPLVYAMVKPKIDLLKKYIPLEGKKILDVGSGNGYFAYYLSEYTDVIASDLSESMLEANPISKKVRCDVSILPFKDSVFDLVVASNLLHHIESPKRVVSEMCRVSKEYVVLSDANRNNPFLFIYSLIRKVDRGALKISKEYLKKILLDLNMHIIFSTTAGFITPNLTPTIFLSFLKKREGLLVSIFGGIYSMVISKK